MIVHKCDRCKEETKKVEACMIPDFNNGGISYYTIYGQPVQPIELCPRCKKQFEILLNDFFNNKVWKYIMNSTQNVFNEYNKNYKGYMYDSLCYRYQLARYKACEADAIDLVMTKGISKREAEAKARQAYERDCLRFYQILYEAMGEHN